MLSNLGFEDEANGWMIDPKELVCFEKFALTTGNQSLKMVVDENTPEGTNRTFTIAQKINMRKFTGQDMVLKCDLLAECATSGSPGSIEIL